ncbi:Probable D,D-dipeptide transport system permease protein ddpC [Kluyvera cryocrescens]|uniref:Probable D,D-dipeptide transport system permease protein ddpC n=1 Tax=Kluyvera cryocrescens TaxID=580 RepID=A0A485BZ66_KLUCR|nr:Probable D,D-dipeptide transport system permease protein ddpC [Kluyvera cryocrescens]
MTVSLDTSLASGGGEGRQRLLRSFTRAGGFIGKMARNPLTAIGGGIIFLLVIVAIFAPWIAPYKPLVQDLNNALTAPNAQHWFGTDEFGRDIFSRLVLRLADYAVHRAAGVGYRGAARAAAWRLRRLLWRQGRYGADARHRYLYLLPKPGAGVGVCRRLRPGT